MEKCNSEDCNGTLDKVLYMGFPMKLCNNRECNLVSGGWSWILFPLSKVGAFNGYFVIYTGSYLKALWFFLKGNEE